MKIYLLSSLFYGLILFSNTVQAQTSISTSLQEDIRSLLETELLKHDRIKGGSVTIYVDGEQWSTSIGVKDSDNTPVAIEDGFMMRSFTKTQTALIIFQLQEEGLLDIDDRIDQHIEAVRNVPESTTIRGLLNMTANTCNYLHNESLSDYSSENTTEYVENIRELLETYNNVSNCNSAHEFKYHDTNTQVLGLIIEELTGNDGVTEFINRIYTPLELTTAILTPKDKITRDFNGAWLNNNNTPIDYANYSTNFFLSAQRFSGGSTMSTEDAMVLLTSMFEGDIISDSSLSEMMTLTPASEGLDDRFLGYGLGFMKFSIHGKDFYGHPGGGVNKSLTLYQPEMKFGISIAGNSDFRDGRLDFTTDFIIAKIIECLEEGDCATATSNEFEGDNASSFSLSQNYPNPFNPSTSIAFQLPEAGQVQLQVFDLLGQEVVTLIDRKMMAGEHSVTFDASQLSSGVYIYRLVAGDQAITKKMMLIK